MRNRRGSRCGNPLDAAAYFNRGVAYYNNNKGDYNWARVDWIEALRL
jgi:hypothetical protein